MREKVRSPNRGGGFSVKRRGLGLVFSSFFFLSCPHLTPPPFFFQLSMVFIREMLLRFPNWSFNFSFFFSFFFVNSDFFLYF
jgi:hypothetical protein